MKKANFATFKWKYRYASLIIVAYSYNYSLWSPEGRNTHIFRNLNRKNKNKWSAAAYNFPLKVLYISSGGKFVYSWRSLTYSLNYCWPDFNSEKCSSVVLDCEIFREIHLSECAVSAFIAHILFFLVIFTLCTNSMKSVGKKNII